MGDSEVLTDPTEISDNDIPEREEWSSKLDFMLSAIGFAVGLGNVWRFPYLCYENGGGAFLLPYIFFLITCGIPVFFMELSIGQYVRLGPIGCWRAICPAFQGIGYAMLVVSFLVSIYYNVILAWSLYYLFESFRSDVPWKHCLNKWNSIFCSEKSVKRGLGIINMTITQADNSTIVKQNCSEGFLPYFSNKVLVNCTFIGKDVARVTPSEDFWKRHVLKISDGIEHIGTIRWELALCLLLAWIIVYFCLWKGVKSSGKVVYFTATFPYLVLIILLIRGVTLDGALDGVKWYLNPDFNKLKDPMVWVRAASQIFYSLGAGWGSLLTFGSYNKFHNNCYRDAMTVSVINCATSVFAGFVIFSVIGHMSFILDEPIQDVVKSGPGLAFVAYPEGIAKMPVSPLWAILFFLMLLTLGLDTMFAIVECVVTGITDEYPKYLRRYKELFVLFICSVCFFIGLTNVTNGGAFVLNLLDFQAGTIPLLAIGCCETVCIGWFYGTHRLSNNIEEMTGNRPNIWWRICWKYATPIILSVLILYTLIKWSGVTYAGDYHYPWWAELLGWLVAFLSMTWIFVFFVIAVCKTQGTCRERWEALKQPSSIMMENEVPGDQKVAILETKDV